MALESTLSIADNFTGPMLSFVNSVRSAMNTFAAFDTQIESGISTDSIESMRSDLESMNQSCIDLATAFARVEPNVESSQHTTREMERDLLDARNRITELENKVKDLTEQLNKSKRGTDDLLSSFKKLAGGYVGIAGIKKMYNWIENCTDAFNVQNNAERQLLSVLGNTVSIDIDTSNAAAGLDGLVSRANAVGTAFESITAKAVQIQLDGIYGDEAMIAAAGEFATYFSDTGAIEMMMDTLSNYAMGMSGGGAVGAQEMVNYATGLGKIMTGSYQAMNMKGFEFTDIQKSIIKGEATRQQIIDQLGAEYADLSQDMQAAATISQVIDESWSGLYRTMSDTPQGKIIQLNNAWGDMLETVGGRLYPYIAQLAETVSQNWDTIETVINGAVSGIESILTLLDFLLDGAFGVARVIVDNWSVIGPIVMTAAIALGVYGGVLGGVKIAQMGFKFAQDLMNGSLFACPIFWVIAGLIAFIGVIGIATAAINNAYGLSLSFGGMLGGFLIGILAVLGNTVIGVANYFITGFDYMWNTVADFANFFANLTENRVGAFWNLWEGLLTNIVESIKWVTDIIDNIFGTNWSERLDGFKDKLVGMVRDVYGEEMDKANITVMEKRSDRLDYINLDDAFETGYYLGDNLGNMFGADYTNQINSALNMSNFPFSDISDIAANTAATADALDITDEDLKYLRDIAERDTVNRFTTAEISVTMGGVTNNVSKDTDLDGIVDYLASSIQTAMEECAEGVHA